MFIFVCKHSENRTNVTPAYLAAHNFHSIVCDGQCIVLFFFGIRWMDEWNELNRTEFKFTTRKKNCRDIGMENGIRAMKGQMKLGKTNINDDETNKHSNNLFRIKHSFKKNDRERERETSWSNDTVSVVKYPCLRCALCESNHYRWQ